MTSESIYAILASKPHNPHYLKRYLKFIEFCTYKAGDYVEKHHICPKAKDLFPEYKSFKKFPWNKKELTARQHVIAHKMLAKIYGGGMWLALRNMINTRSVEFTNNSYDVIRQNANQIISSVLTGTVRYSLPDGTYYARLPKDHPDVLRLNLIPQSTEKQKEQAREQQKKTAQSLVGRKIYTNGVIEIKCHDHPGEGWWEGRKPRSKSHSENHRKATSEKRRNTFVVNDGYRNVYLKIGDPIPEGYSLGMAPRRK